jgi:hypothetical protein
LEGAASAVDASSVAAKAIHEAERRSGLVI